MPAGDLVLGLPAICLQTQSSGFGIPPDTSAKLHFAMELVTGGMRIEKTALADGAWEISVLPSPCSTLMLCLAPPTLTCALSFL